MTTTSTAVLTGKCAVMVLVFITHGVDKVVCNYWPRVWLSSKATTSGVY